MVEAKLAQLREKLTAAAPFLVAVSGGVDSRVLLATAVRIGIRCEAVIFLGPHQSPADRARGVDFLATSGVAVHRMEFNPLEWEEGGGDPKLRCYRCKRGMFGLAKVRARERGLAHLLDGTQADDRSAFRPGQKALEELGVLSPLAESGLGKAEIRTLARRFGLERPDQPSKPCLLTRFPYGYHPSPQELSAVGSAEDGLSSLGLGLFRVRFLREKGYVLHLSGSERQRFLTVKEDAERILALMGLGEVQVSFPDQVSGYFDTNG
jgi:pyridinium-3,5-biscarboxylic acid mononucleotide sulfurtransferase